MPKQLDILALEPFYGGARRNMLETVIRCSRHRWTLLKLPPRRIERRLAAAAHWFAEQLSRHWVGRLDLLFTSEALNLADLYRLMPPLAHKPAVVFFHENQLPEPGMAPTNVAIDYANLNTAAAATEMWFNSKYHVRAFLAGVSALVATNEELAAQNPIPALTGKIRYIPPPVDVIGAADPTASRERTIFVETRNANVELLNAALKRLKRQVDELQLITVGPVEGIDDVFPRQPIVESDLAAQAEAMRRSSLFVSVRSAATFDEHAVRALWLGCWPVLPRTGVYPELLPKSMHGQCLYDVDAQSLANCIYDSLDRQVEPDNAAEIQRITHQFDAIAACKSMDERLDELAQARPTGPAANLPGDGRVTGRDQK